MDKRSETAFLKEVRRRLVTARRKKGYTQVRLAVESGIAESHIAQIEGGFRNPTLITLHRLCTGLGLKVSDLLDGI